MCIVLILSYDKKIGLNYNTNNILYAKVTLAEDGVKGLAKGWAPTFIGYSMQVCLNPIHAVAALKQSLMG